MESNILFYSNKCHHCKQLIQLIKDTNTIKIFKLISIDENKNKYPSIKRVPTLIINNQDFLVGVKAFEWVKTKSQFNLPSNNINYNPNKYISQNSMIYNDNNNVQINNNIEYSYIKEDNDDKQFNNYNTDNLLNNKSKIFNLRTKNYNKNPTDINKNRNEFNKTEVYQKNNLNSSISRLNI